MRYKFAAVAASLALLLPGCVPPPKPAPVVKPAPPPVARPAPPPPVVTPPLSANWNDWPFTLGDWVYRKDGVGSIGLFGPPGGDALLTLRCDRTRGALYLSVEGSGDAATIRTTSLSRSIALRRSRRSRRMSASSRSPSRSRSNSSCGNAGRRSRPPACPMSTILRNLYDFVRAPAR